MDDCMEYFVAGASAVQLGTVNFFDPLAPLKILAALPEAITHLGASRFADIVGCATSWKPRI
jgi:dihydroorotate dehydrogenase (NAD+) catalytic subunit